MKRFEHEVLTFETSTKKGIEKMQEKLHEWGQAGFEIVGVAPITVGGSVVTVFLKREVAQNQFKDDEVA